MSDREVVYLSGPMTGYEDFNRTAFATAAAELRSRGYEVINPAEDEYPLPEEMETWTATPERRAAFLSKDILDIVTRAHLVVVLPGWAESEGARDEVRVAQIVGVPVFRFDDFTPLENPAVVTVPRIVRDKYKEHPYGY